MPFQNFWKVAILGFLSGVASYWYWLPKEQQKINSLPQSLCKCNLVLSIKGKKR